MKRAPASVFQLQVPCPACRCSFTLLSWGVRSSTFAFCPSCGLTFRVPLAIVRSRGHSAPWSPGSLPLLPAPALPANQLSLF